LQRGERLVVEYNMMATIFSDFCTCRVWRLTRWYSTLLDVGDLPSLALTASCCFILTAQALATLDQLSVVSAAVGVLATIVAVSQAIAEATLRSWLPPTLLPALRSTGVPLPSTLPGVLSATAVAVACLLLWLGLQRFRRKFIYEDWVLALR
jgi:hypothetical protein